jgi:hypothetical protein
MLNLAPALKGAGVYRGSREHKPPDKRDSEAVATRVVAIASVCLHPRSSAVAARDWRSQKKTPLGTVWVVPAEIKEAMQLPAQHRQLQLRASEEERRENPLMHGHAAEPRIRLFDS